MDRVTTLKEKQVVPLSSLRESAVAPKNQSVLNNLGESATGQLTYKGDVVGISPLYETEFNIDYNKCYIMTPNDYMITLEADLPENSRVRKIEILDSAISTEYINLEDITRFDTIGNEAPYFFMFPKNKLGVNLPVAAHICFPKFTNEFYGLAAGYAFTGKLKIYYEIEE